VGLYGSGTVGTTSARPREEQVRYFPNRWRRN
jgi:hypothetical protein